MKGGKPNRSIKRIIYSTAVMLLLYGMDHVKAVGLKTQLNGRGNRLAQVGSSRQMNAQINSQFSSESGLKDDEEDLDLQAD